MLDNLLPTVKYTVELLKENGITIATAESCTGGLLSALITSVSGASSVFELGVTSYSSRIKSKILGVKKEDLDSFGAVSRQTAAQMAENVRLLSGSDIGVSVTGNAGPNSSEGKPVGLVYIGLATDDDITVKELNIQPISRDYVRNEACLKLLTLVSEYINSRKEEQK